MRWFYAGLILGLIVGGTSGIVAMALAASAGSVDDGELSTGGRVCPACLGGDGPWCSRCQGRGVVDD